jgi:serine/threonine-protein kinase
MMRDAMRDRWGGLSIERQLRGFQGSVASYAVVIPGLALVNIATGPFPWVLFPAMGWGLGLLGQAAALRRAGVSPMDALLGRSEFDREERDRALAKGGEAAVAERVDRFKRTATIASVVAGVTSVAFVVGTGAHIHGLVAPFVVGAMATALMGIATLRRALALRPFGIRLRDAWNGTWREALSRDDPAMVGKLLDAEMAKRLPADVMSGPYGETVRAAAQDRAAILETVARLGPADRELIPDVVPTVKGLEERIAMLAGSLHRMAGDVSPDQLAQLTSRIATMEAGVGGADRERTLALLKRQRETLADLVERRENLQAQLDSATLLLQTIKLDLLRLRSAGVQSAIRDVSTATQEARALSKDIGNALDVAAELRKI